MGLNFVAGFGAAPFLFMALSPLNPDLLTRIPDKDLFLCLAGFLALVVCGFALFENDT